MNQMVILKFGVGVFLCCKEDMLLIMGQGIYMVDYQLEGCFYLVVVCLLMVYVRIMFGNVEDFCEMDGVQLVLIGVDVVGKVMLIQVRLKQIDGFNFLLLLQLFLCSDIVCYVGDVIVYIVVDDLNVVKNVVEMFEIDYELLFVVVEMEDVFVDGVEKVWLDFGINVVFIFGYGDEVKMDVVFVEVFKIVFIDLVNNCIVVNYMELCGCVVEFDGGSDCYWLILGI